MFRGDVHKHRVDLYTRSVNMHANGQLTTEWLTHVLQILFTNLDQRRDLLDFFDRQLRKTSGEYNIVACNQRLVPKGTPCDVIWTFVLELSAEGIPETSVLHLGMVIDSDNANRWISWRDSYGTPRKLREIITLGFALTVLVSVKP